MEEENVRFLLNRLYRLRLLRGNSQDKVACRDFFTVSDDDHFQNGLLLDDQRVQVDVGGGLVKLRGERDTGVLDHFPVFVE